MICRLQCGYRYPLPSDRTISVLEKGKIWGHHSQSTPTFKGMNVQQIFNISMNDLGERVQGMPIKFADDTELGGMVNTLGDRNKIQNDFNRLKDWPEINRINLTGISAEFYTEKKTQSHS